MHPYLTNVLEFGPKLMAYSCRRLPTESWDEPTGPGRFTPREILAHLADWEPVFLARMQQAVRLPGSVLKVWDEGQWAIDHRYAESDPEASLAAFAKARSETAEFLRKAPIESFAAAALHPEKGLMTVDDMANMLLGHDLYHLEQIEEASLRY
ncbi:MAG: DinB family protein [Fimbriimonadaceae bacterium]|nr:DinB family protein [Fimbriimonadaceae bacterium]QYK56912.1 MAG: DinB family protein [Fimbriimonadaceae bacterium]